MTELRKQFVKDIYEKCEEMRETEEAIHVMMIKDDIENILNAYDMEVLAIYG